MLREPAVAGQFYPGQRGALEQNLRQLIPVADQQRPVIGIMSPHAGYMYSGAVAGKTFASIVVPHDVVVLGPNHHGYGHSAAVYPQGSWQTPLGEVPIIEKLAADILAECPMTAEDSLAHRYEHSLEVQIPFLQIKQNDCRIVPICISRLPLRSLLDLGAGLARAISAFTDPVLMVASSDMTHFEPGDVAKRKDEMALERVLALDPEGLYDIVSRHRISMCGMIPTVVMLQAAIALGATGAELVGYSNSGDVTGDQSDVVGYAGVQIF